MAEGYEVDIGIRYTDHGDWAKINAALSPWESRRHSSGSSLGDDPTRDAQFGFESAEDAKTAAADMESLMETFGFVVAYCHVHGPGGQELSRLSAPSRRCPRCEMVTYNPTDIAEGYCGNCHDRT
jgi:hypothetical protein